MEFGSHSQPGRYVAVSSNAALCCCGRTSAGGRSLPLDWMQVPSHHLPSRSTCRIGQTVHPLQTPEKPHWERGCPEEGGKGKTRGKPYYGSESQSWIWFNEIKKHKVKRWALKICSRLYTHSSWKKNNEKKALPQRWCYHVGQNLGQRLV